MATVVQLNFGVNRIVDNFNSTGAIPQQQVLISSTSNKFYSNSQNVGTTHELLVVGDITDDCMMILRNTHASAVFELGVVVSGTFYPTMKIPPGERAIIPRLSSLSGTYLKSTVADAELETNLYKIAT